MNKTHRNIVESNIAGISIVVENEKSISRITITDEIADTVYKMYIYCFLSSIVVIKSRITTICNTIRNIGISINDI